MVRGLWMVAFMLIAVIAGAATEAAASVKKAPFGKADGKTVEIYTLTNSKGAVARIMTFGATLTELHVPDRTGKLGDVVLGFNNFAAYAKGHPFFGSTVGRVGNRIANAQFILDGQSHQLAANNGPN